MRKPLELLLSVKRDVNSTLTKFIIIFFLGYIAASCRTSIASENNDFILWNGSEQLTFKDFKGKFSPKVFTTDLDGRCATQCRFEHIIDKNTRLPKFTIKCYFLRKDSFIRYKNDTITLRHEQVHFNIEELFCRLTRKSWDSLNALKVRTLSPYNAVKYKHHKLVARYNRNFDENQTTIALDSIDDKTEQYVRSNLQTWEVKLREELRALEEYKE
ncbi:MAG: hypothetical protein EOO46_03825 [Flavobacterium sp.]|nr:MAG: hypothetical protein EOO46_03825 [Flavobacterium sp.]